MLYEIDPTHQKHRLQVEYVMFGDDAEHTQPAISFCESDCPSSILLRKPDMAFSQLQH
jgi:hypothetical protein